MGISKEVREVIIGGAVRFGKEEEIAKEVYKETRKRVSVIDVRKFLAREDVRREVMQRRRAVMGAIEDVAIANKRYRLEKLQWLLDEIESEAKAARNVSKYSMRIMRVLKEARDEVREIGDKGNLGDVNFVQNNYIELTDEELDRRTRDIMKRIEAIEGKICGEKRGDEAEGELVMEAIGSDACGKQDMA